MNKANSVFGQTRSRVTWMLQNGGDEETCLATLTGAFKVRFHADPAPAIVERWKELLAGLPRRCGAGGCG